MTPVSFALSALAADPNLAPSLRGLFCVKHQPLHLQRISAAHPQLQNVCAACGSKIMRASVTEPWRVA